MSENDTRLDTWAVVEIMGHKVYAGRVTEHGPFIRIDVPAVEGVEAYSKLFGASSIYCITPCTEEVARVAANRHRARPLDQVCTVVPSQGRLDFRNDDEPDDGDDWHR